METEYKLPAAPHKETNQWPGTVTVEWEGGGYAVVGGASSIREAREIAGRFHDGLNEDEDPCPESYAFHAVASGQYPQLLARFIP